MPYVPKHNRYKRKPCPVCGKYISEAGFAWQGHLHMHRREQGILTSNKKQDGSLSSKKEDSP